MWDRRSINFELEMWLVANQNILQVFLVEREWRERALFVERKLLQRNTFTKLWPNIKHCMILSPIDNRWSGTEAINPLRQMKKVQYCRIQLFLWRLPQIQHRFPKRWLWKSSISVLARWWSWKLQRWGLITFSSVIMTKGIVNMSTSSRVLLRRL